MAAQKTGLTAHLIRIWEKRYGAVTPNRSDSQRRLYSEEEIERLSLLRVATQSGHRIGDIARLSDGQLRTLVSEIPPGLEPSPHPSSSNQQVLDDAVSAIKQMDSDRLEEFLDESAVRFGHHGTLEHVVGPLARLVGELWRDGAITAGHEHFFSNIVRKFLLQKLKTSAPSESAPRLIVATPAGQLHELGAAIVAAAARDMGWQVYYLGPNLPATDIAGAARQHNANAVALSIVFPGDDPNLPQELDYLRSLLPKGIRILAGGRAAMSYSNALEKIGAIRVPDLKTLYAFLERSRMPETQPNTEVND